MKTITTLSKRVAFRLLSPFKSKSHLSTAFTVLLSINFTFGQSVTETFTSSSTWTVPNGVSSVTVQVWGAGGSGGNGAKTNQNFPGGAGGGGGAYTTATLNVSSGQIISYTVGSGGLVANGQGGNGGNGGSSTFMTLIANGGSKGGDGGSSQPSAGTGGSFSGGTGASGFNGSNPGSIGGAGGNNGNGTGGAIQNNQADSDGTNGSIGGGGSGGYGQNKKGGNGGNGQIIISYTIVIPVPICVSSPLSPADASSNVPFNQQLTWSSVQNATGYDVYFGTSSNPPLVSTNQAGTTYNPGTLSASTNYFWKIVPKNNSGEPSNCTVWGFSTGLSGCTSGNLFPSSTFTPACSGSPEDITNMAYAGEYSNVNLTSGTLYNFSSSVSTDYITITNSSGNVILASGTTPLMWTSNTTGTVRYYFHTNSSCGTQAVYRIRRIQCGIPCPTITVNAGSDVTICAGNEAQLSGTVTVSNATASTTPVSSQMTSAVSDQSNTEVVVTLSGAPSGSLITSVIFTPRVWVRINGVNYYSCANYNSWVKMQYWNGSAWVDISDCNQQLTINNFNGNAVNGQQIKIRTVDANGTSDLVLTDLLNVSANYTYTPTATYLWTGGSIVSGSTSLNPVINPSVNSTYTLTATAAGCSASDAVAVTVNSITTSTTFVTNDMIWNGKTSSDFATVSNWLQYNGTSTVPATTLPSTSTNVILPAAQTCILNQPSLGSNAVNAKNVIIENGATLSLGSGSLNLSGHFENNGTLNAGTGTVAFIGTTTQNIDGTNPTTFYNLTIDNDHSGVYPSHVAVKLEQNAAVTNILTLTDGILDIFDHVLTLGTPSSKVIISPNLGTADSYIAAHHNEGNHVGYIKQFVHSSNIGTPYRFPIGDDDKWTPFNLTFNAGSSLAAGSFITSHVNDTLILGSNNSAFSNRVKRDWEVEPSAGITTPNYTIEIFHNQNSLEFGGTASSGIVPFKLSSGTLYAPSSSGINSASIVNQGTYTTGANSYTWSGLTTFSNFGGTEVISALPIELVSFQANCTENNAISVTWTTASEHNTSHYVVEKSRDGINWSLLGQTAAAGNSTELLNYEMIDSEKANGTTYYRLTQYDNDGVYEVFDPVSVNCNGTTSNNHIMTYPNPSDAGFYVSLFTETMEGNGQLNIMDGSGRTVYSTSVNIQDGNNVFHIGDMNAAPGMYYIQVSNGTTTTDIVKHSLR